MAPAQAHPAAPQGAQRKPPRRRASARPGPLLRRAAPPRRGALLLALLLAPLLAAALPAPAGADHVEVNDRTFPTGACERVCIPAVVEPRFAPTPYLGEDAAVIGVEHRGDARAYPVEVLVWHEIVNDVVGGTPLAVTYCPLCGSSLVFEREVDGRVLTFQTSGRLHRNDLVMLDDETRSLWPQILGEAVSGPLHGTRLQALGSVLTTWGQWRTLHPQTMLLARPLCSDWPYAVSGCSPTSPAEARRYGADPYAGYAESRRIGISDVHLDDVEGLHPKALVVGVVRDGVPKAWEVARAAHEVVINDQVGRTPVVVAALDGSVRVFQRGAEQRFTTLNATHMQDPHGTAWHLGTGRAADGRALEELPATTSFWFAWLDFHPGTHLHGAVRVIEGPPREGRLPNEQPLVVRFTHSMDRASVEQGLALEPAHPVALAWVDEATLRLQPREPWPEGARYLLRIEGARAEDGTSLEPWEAPFRAGPRRLEQVGAARGAGRRGARPAGPGRAAAARPVRPAGPPAKGDGTKGPPTPRGLGRRLGGDIQRFKRASDPLGRAGGLAPGWPPPWWSDGCTTAFRPRVAEP